jgi:hypothetical protein
MQLLGVDRRQAAILRCLRCGRILTDPSSAKRGLGPDCQSKDSTARLLKMRRVEQLSHSDDLRAPAARKALADFHAQGLVGMLRHHVDALLKEPSRCTECGQACDKVLCPACLRATGRTS